jgi:eukaryotic-like serine/threonine-protein kinase
MNKADTLSEALVSISGRSGPELPVIDERRFEVAGERARGGAGLVFEANDRLLGRRIALKQPQEDRGAGEARFLREALITARLQHPAIVPIYDVGVRASGEPCYSMRLVPGDNLRDAIAAARGLDERLALLPHVQAVADAMAYAHAQGILHRDLKPANVLVGPFGETVVIDWGLAKDLRGDLAAAEGATLALEPAGPPELTRTGSVVGTPAYMSPEQARGEELDERADVFAIGAMLYQLLTGQAPRPYAGAETTDMVGGVAPSRRVEAHEPGAPADLVAIVVKAMAVDRNQRYPTAQALAHDLKRFATGQLVGARRYSTWALIRRGLRRHRATAVVGAGLIAALVVGAAGVLGARDRAEAEANRLRLRQAQALLERDPTAAVAWLKSHRLEPEGESDGVDVAARAGAAGVARHVLALPDQAPMRVCLAASGRLAGVLGRRGAIWLFDLAGGTHRELGRLAGPPMDCMFVDGDRHLVAWVAHGGGVVAARLPDGHATPLSVPARGVRSLLPGPGGRLIVTGNDGRVHIAGLDATPPRTLDHLPAGLVETVPAPDGASLYASDGTGALWRIPIEGGPSELVERLDTPINKIAFSSDGQRLVFASSRHVVLRDLASGRSERLLARAVPGNPIHALPAHGGAIFIAGPDATVAWWNPATGEQVPLGTGANFKALEVTHGGERAAWIDTNGAIFVADLESRVVRKMVGHHTGLRGFDMTGDGRLLATTHGPSVRVFALPPVSTGRRIDLEVTGRVDWGLVRAVPSRNLMLAAVRRKALTAIDGRTGSRRLLLEFEDPIHWLAASPGGTRAAAGAADGRLVIVDLETGASRDLGAGGRTLWERLTFVGEDLLLGFDKELAVHSWDLVEGSHRVVVPAPRRQTPGGGHGLVLASHRGPRALVGRAQELLVIGPRSGERIALASPGGSFFRAALSRDGRRVAAGYSDGRVAVWEVDAPKPRILGRREGFVSGLVFSANERELYVTDETGSVARYDLTGGTAVEMGRHAARITGITLSPSGNRLASYDTTGEIRLWEPATRRLAILKGQGELWEASFLGEDGILSAAKQGWMELAVIDAGSLVPAAPAALSRWLDTLTTAQLGAAGEPVSP